MKISDIKSIIDQKFYKIQQKSLIEEQWPDASNVQKGPYKEITIDNKRGVNYLVMRMEGENLTFFSSNAEPPKGLYEMCDYFMFVEVGDKLEILMIEIKGDSVAHAKSQLNAGECFIKYVIDTAKRISIDVDNIKKKKIIIREGKAFKRSTSYKAYELDDDVMKTYCENSGDSFKLQFFI